MYEAFYNLTADPFRISPDNSFCYEHPSYAKARAYMIYGLHRAEGVVILTGAMGTGKTTLSNDLFARVSTAQVAVGRIMSTQWHAHDFLRAVAFSFGLEAEGVDKATVVHRLEEFLAEQSRRGRRSLLIVDDAQEMNSLALKGLLPLVNFQIGKQPLMQVFLLGTEGLRDSLRSKDLEQLQHRVIAQCSLEPLNPSETQTYVMHGLNQAGWKSDPRIAADVFPLLYQFSLGVPRRINLVASRLLLYGSMEQKHELRAEDVQLVIEELSPEALTPTNVSPVSQRHSEPVPSKPHAPGKVGVAASQGNRTPRREQTFRMMSTEESPVVTSLAQALKESLQESHEEAPQSEEDTLTSIGNLASDTFGAKSFSRNETMLRTSDETQSWTDEFDRETREATSATAGTVTEVLMGPRSEDSNDDEVEDTGGWKTSHVRNDSRPARHSSEPARSGRTSLALKNFAGLIAGVVIGVGFVILASSQAISLDPTSLRDTALSTWHSLSQWLTDAWSG